MKGSYIHIQEPRLFIRMKEYEQFLNEKTAEKKNEMTEFFQR